MQTIWTSWLASIFVRQLDRGGQRRTSAAHEKHSAFDLRFLICTCSVHTRLRHFQGGEQSSRSVAFVVMCHGAVLQDFFIIMCATPTGRLWNSSAGCSQLQIGLTHSGRLTLHNTELFSLVPVQKRSPWPFQKRLVLTRYITYYGIQIPE